MEAKKNCIIGAAWECAPVAARGLAEGKSYSKLQGDPGDLFYIIKEGEAVVYQDGENGRRKVNQLFKADFFGERALLSDEPRYALVTTLWRE